MFKSMKNQVFISRLFVGLLLVAGMFTAAAADKRIVLVAGRPSHGPGDHEHRAGCLLLQQCLNQVPGVHAEVYTNGWPQDTNVFAGAAAVVVYSDGGDGHPFIRPNRLSLLGDLMKEKVGFGCLHYAVEVPKDRGGRELLDWTGGYFETFWSVNPTWVSDFKEIPAHDITRGVKPFKINDEWYYHMRFREEMRGVTPILTAIPPERTHLGKDDAHGGNATVRARVGQPEHMMWACTRPDGGRGFGFTGGHYHKNWGDENFRKVVLNAILWIAQVEVPKNGVESTVSAEDLKKNLDPK